MKTIHHWIIRSILALAVACLAAPARAQLVPDGGTNVLDGVTNSVSGDLTVGTNGNSTMLSLTNAAAVDVSGQTVIGYDAVSFSNVVDVAGVGSRFATLGNSFVGFNGSGNQLLITDGGYVSNGNGYISGANNADNNRVTVNGLNSTWNSSGQLYVGHSGSSNALLIANGGRVANTSGRVGLMFTAKNNYVTVTDANSLWTNSDALYVGWRGSANTLLITNGGRVENTFGYIGDGYIADGYPPAGGSNNQVIVTGSNSVWNNSFGFVVGYSSTFGSLRIANGGVVRSKVGYIGYGFPVYDPGTANYNEVIVGGLNSLWTNSGNLYVGSNGSFNTLTITNNGYVVTSNCFIGYGSVSNSVVVSDTTSVFKCRSTLHVGYLGTFNTMLIAGGGEVQAGDFYLSFNTGSSNNLLSVINSKLIVTNVVRTAVFDVRRGSVIFNGGDIRVDQLILNNSNGIFAFNAGTLKVRAATISNSMSFIVGDGTNAAVLDLVGGRINSFADGLLIQTNATLTGTGTIKGTVTNCGTISLTNTNQMTFTGWVVNKGVINAFGNGLLIQTNATLTGTGTINGSVTNCGTIFLTNADQMIFTGPLVNKGVIIAVTGTPRFGSTFTNLGTLITTASINVANASVSGDDIVLQFNSVSNYLHEVQASTNVSSGLWQSLTNGLLGTGSPITFTDVGGALTSNRTYRVLLH